MMDQGQNSKCGRMICCFMLAYHMSTRVNTLKLHFLVLIWVDPGDLLELTMHLIASIKLSVS